MLYNTNSFLPYTRTNVKWYKPYYRVFLDRINYSLKGYQFSQNSHYLGKQNFALSLVFMNNHLLYKLFMLVAKNSWFNAVNKRNHITMIH